MEVWAVFYVTMAIDFLMTGWARRLCPPHVKTFIVIGGHKNHAHPTELLSGAGLILDQAPGHMQTHFCIFGKLMKQMMRPG